MRPYERLMVGRRLKRYRRMLPYPGVEPWTGEGSHHSTCEHDGHLTTTRSGHLMLSNFHFTTDIVPNFLAFQWGRLFVTITGRKNEVQGKYWNLWRALCCIFGHSFLKKKMPVTPHLMSHPLDSFLNPLRRFCYVRMGWRPRRTSRLLSSMLSAESGRPQPCMTTLKQT